MQKVIFVTGATRNSGLAIAKKFAAAGYAVALSSRRAKDAAATASMLQETYGVPCKGYGLQLTDVEEIRTVFNDVKKNFGRLDVFVYRSGMYDPDRAGI